MAGQYYDDETGLHYNWHRHYDPKAGRYLTPDPIGLIGGVNVYAYTLNNPVNYIDQYGLLGWDVLGYSFSTAGGIMIFMSSAPAWATPVGVGLFVGGWAISHWDSYSTARYYISIATNILNFYNEKFDEVDKMNDRNDGCGY